MKSDPKECLYCQNNETLHNLMIEIAQLSVSRVFLFKEQTYRGRCLVSYKDHVNDLNELSDEDRNAFMADVARVTRAMQKAFQPEKINYGAYSDKLSHLHFHLAPKYYFYKYIFKFYFKYFITFPENNNPFFKIYYF